MRFQVLFEEKKMMKKILIINGHPDPNSYNAALAQAYKSGAEMVSSVIDEIRIADLNFDPNLKYGYRKRTELEPDLLKAINKIKVADHLVWVFPMWWYGYPALMKGFIDRVFLPGITFQPVDGKSFPAKLLRGKSARIIITADTPRWFDFLYFKSPTLNQFRKGTLKFCGVNPVKVTYIAPIKGAGKEFTAKWLYKVKSLGVKMA